MKNKNKKGFTLIELLAIIVILAIIAVITVPIILNIIENSKRGAAIDSAYGYKEAVSKYYVTQLSGGSDLQLTNKYIVNDGVLNGTGIDHKEIPISGNKPMSGYLKYSNNVLIDGCLTFGDYKVTFGSDGSVSGAEKGACPSIQERVLYYTYDANGTRDLIGHKNSQKFTEPNSIWKTYIKETTLVGEPAYAIELTINGDTFIGSSFDSKDECEEKLAQSGMSASNAQCKQFDNKVINEVYGVDNGKLIHLKANDYLNSKKTADDFFENSRYYEAYDQYEYWTDYIGVFVSKDGSLNFNGNFGGLLGDSVGGCSITKYGFTGCFYGGISQ